MWKKYNFFSFISSGRECTCYNENSHQSFSGYFSKAKNGGVRPKDWSDCIKTDISISSTANFLEVVTRFSFKVANKTLFRGKKLWKSRFSGYFSKAKTDEWDQIILSLSDKLGVIISSLDTYFLEVSADPLMKVGTKASFRGRKYKKLAFLGYFSKAKMEECNQNDWSACIEFVVSGSTYMRLIESSRQSYFLEVKKNF